ncbi:unnamed protein product [Owenia fusiformis]|uniref:Uncharacterized protein n=1 Tax=Owenia fusiformis TaxID=6347 RepID=A0A8J1UIP1_OWEFU|nr:unnamed protein product [Owenia fusiformis]
MDKIGRKRSLFGRQPVRILLVDSSPPMDEEICQNLTAVLGEMFAVVSNLNGPSRSPFFGLLVLGVYPEVLFPLQHVKGNTGKLHAALQELQNVSLGSSAHSDTGDCLCMGLKEAALQYRRQSRSFAQVGGYWNQLEVIFVTSKSGDSVSKHIQRISHSLDLDVLKKILVVSVTNTGRLNLEEESGECNQTVDMSLSNLSELEEIAQCSDIVDTISLEHDKMCLENFFKGWLLDTSTDSEHVHIILQQEKGSLIVKCDIQERLLNPAQLPFNSQFGLNQENTKAQTSGAVKSTQVNIPVYQLRVINLISSDSLCESVLFGMPYIMRPTSCWKIDWDELEINQQHFNALTSLLKNKELVILARIDSPNEGQGSKGSYSTTVPLAPCGHFIILPSEGGSMLIKSVAVNELMLPCENSILADSPSQTSLETVEAALAQVEVLPSYNPLKVKSGLNKSLVAMVTKGMPRQPLKRKPTRGGTTSNTGVPSYHSAFSDKPFGTTHGTGRGNTIQVRGQGGTTSTTQPKGRGYTAQHNDKFYSSKKVKFSGRDIYGRPCDVDSSFPTEL